jgi:hypothetical protein
MFRAFFCILMMWGALASVGWSQMKSQAELMVASSPKAAGQRVVLRAMGTEAQRRQAWNSDRHEKLVSETNRLLALVANFNQQASRGDVELSPADVTKTAAEIEKLARSVKDRMRE